MTLDEAWAELRREIESLPVSQYPIVKGAAVEALVSRAAVLAIVARLAVALQSQEAGE